MSNELVVYQQFDQIQRAAVALQKSGYFSDVKSEAQAIVKVLAGAELGLPPFASMTGIHIIQGKPALGSNVIATLVKNDPRYDYRVKVATDNECVLEWLEAGHGVVGEAGFTMKEAQAAGLTGKDNWKKFPSDMLFARAISRGARRFAPGIFGGSPVYTPDELGADTDEEGYITGEVVSVVVEPDNGKVAQVNNESSTETVSNAVDVYQAVVDAGLSDNPHSARTLLQNHCKTGYATDEQAVAWVRKYRAAKDEGMTTVEAAAVANG